MVELICIGKDEFLVLYAQGDGEPNSFLGEEVGVIELLQSLGVSDWEISLVITRAVERRGVRLLANRQAHC
jgi:hypothetical protein